MDEPNDERTPHDLLVPRVDEQDGAAVYDPSISAGALAGGVIGGGALGLLAGLFGAGTLPIEGLGHWAAAGTAPIAFAGAGIGASAGALCGALLALFRLPARRPAPERTSRAGESVRPRAPAHSH